MNNEQQKNLAETIRQISGVNPRLCMKCGKCTATCPAFDEMDISPHQFVNLVEKGQFEKLLQSKTIWNCLSCFACVERCPRTVEPANLIEAVRLALIRQQGMNHLKPEQIPQCLDENLPQQAITSAFRKYSK